MKKVSATCITVFTMVVLLAGCQATPDEPVVIQKDMQQMIEKAAESDTAQTQGMTLRERTGAPETYKKQDASGKLKLSANAPVILPETDAMPILNVRSAVFSQDIVDRYWNALVGDTPMWQWSDQPTKADIEQMIINQKQMQEQAEQEGSDTKGYEDIIKELERLHNSAPATADVTPAGSGLKEMLSWDPVLGTIDTRYMGTSGSSVKSKAEVQNAGDWIYFGVNNPWTGEEGGIKSDTMPATLRFEAAAINNNYGASGWVTVDENTKLDDTVKQYMKTTPAEAVKIVNDFLKRTGTPMKIYSVEMMNDAYEPEGKPAQHYAYRINCVRILDGGLTTVIKPRGGPIYFMIMPGYMPAPSAPKYSAYWGYEFLTLELNDDGFFQICWQSPLEVLDAEVGDCQLLPFEDIEAVFDKLLFVSYEPGIEEGYTMTCDISQVRLEMMRVRKQDSDPNVREGLLIPAWSFYGNLKVYDSDGTLSGSSMEGIILTINAIDGSVIDIGEGY